MYVAITGSAGLVGTELTRHLKLSGHRVTALRRPGSPGSPDDGSTWDPARGRIADGALEGCDAVVHLAGASIGEGRWTASRKRELRQSRIEATRLLVGHLASLEQRPRVLVSASAVGIYGHRGEEALTEDSSFGTGFLAELAADWEREARRAEALGVRVVTPRFGVILDRDASALQRMMLPIKLGVGGPLGHGRQWMPWVTLADVTRAIEFFLSHEETRGAYNVVAPDARRNREFTKVLARQLRRPALFPVPAIALRLLIGGAADALLLSSAHVIPTRLQEAGFTFQHPKLDEALKAVLAQPEVRTPAVRVG